MIETMPPPIKILINQFLHNSKLTIYIHSVPTVIRYIPFHLYLIILVTFILIVIPILIIISTSTITITITFTITIYY